MKTLILISVLAILLIPNTFEVKPAYAVTLTKPLPEVARLIFCESGGKSVKILDSNNQYSYGILQFQKGTWSKFSKESGITGDPMNKEDAIRMGNWAYKNGKIRHWLNCAKIEKLL